jgi:hypothetical protein
MLLHILAEKFYGKVVAKTSITDGSNSKKHPEKLTDLHLVKKFSPFMEPEVSFPHSEPQSFCVLPKDQPKSEDLLNI